MGRLPQLHRIHLLLQHDLTLQGYHRSSHKVLIYIEHHSVCPLVGIGTLPIPLPQASVCPPSPHGPRVHGGHTHLRLKGWGSPHSDDWRKSLALCLLCGSSGISKCGGKFPTSASKSLPYFSSANNYLV